MPNEEVVNLMCSLSRVYDEFWILLLADVSAIAHDDDERARAREDEKGKYNFNFILTSNNNSKQAPHHTHIFAQLACS